MNLILIGINHKTAPIEIRESFFLSPIQQDLALSELKSDVRILDALVLSTCNRTEVYINTIEEEHDVNKYIDLLLQIKKLSQTEYSVRQFYTYRNKQAVEHLMKVASGLDSLVIGEKQILGQVKAAVDRARERGMFYKPFNILANMVLRTGKKAHSQTDISHGGSSISWAAITLAEKVLGTLQDKTMLVIGAGKMSELAVGHISSKNFKKLYLMNRTKANAEKLAEKYQSEVVPFCDIKEILNKVDVCICCSDAPHFVLEYDAVKKIKTTSPDKILILIDISMPRNIDPLVSDIKNVQLFHIDELQEAIAESMKKRLDAIHDVEKIVQKSIKDFYSKIQKVSEKHLPNYSQAEEVV